jgi:CheY-like chemotaxis protein
MRLPNTRFFCFREVDLEQVCRNRVRYRAMTKTALIVEDEIFVALDLERILTEAGYTVTAIAADRETALAAAPECGIAFVDVNLRDGPTGPDIAARMARDYGVRCVFVTANPTQIGDGGGALGYIRKPFSDAAILAAARLAGEGVAPTNGDVVVLR